MENMEKEKVSHSLLRERYNPDGSLLRQVQMRMLCLLEVFDSICRKHAIPYWLSSGTLLGAVRHGGFIPWDDDLDVEMLREDYLKLRKILPGELPADVVLQDHATDPGYFSTFGKLRDLNSVLEDSCGYDRLYRNRGVFIDIFSLESMPLCFAKLARKLQGFLLSQYGKELTDEQLQHRCDRIFAINEGVVFPFLRLGAKMLPSLPLHHTYGSFFFAPRFREDIFPLGEIEFEGRKFLSPKDPDRVLRRLYGNYMEFPPLEEIKERNLAIVLKNKEI